MIRKATRRAAIWTAGIGLVVGPMSIASPQVALAACQNPGPGYPGGINTATALQLDQSVGRYGERNRATASVSSNQGTPDGVVRFFVDGNRYAQRVVGPAGNASIQLPRGLRAGKTHTVRARFISECPYNDSQSGVRYYTVNRSGTTTDIKIRNKRKARFAATIRGNEGLTPQGGNVRFTVRRNSKDGKLIRSRTVRNRAGFASVDLKNLNNGRYFVRARYIGDSNFKPSQDGQQFRVSR